MVLPYRHPLYWTRIAATIDQLSTGWMEEEFAAMNAPFKGVSATAARRPAAT